MRSRIRADFGAGRAALRALLQHARGGYHFASGGPTQVRGWPWSSPACGAVRHGTSSFSDLAAERTASRTTATSSSRASSSAARTARPVAWQMVVKRQHQCSVVSVAPVKPLSLVASSREHFGFRGRFCRSRSASTKAPRSCICVGNWVDVGGRPPSPSWCFPPRAAGPELTTGPCGIRHPCRRARRLEPKLVAHPERRRRRSPADAERALRGWTVPERWLSSQGTASRGAPWRRLPSAVRSVFFVHETF